MGFLRRALTGLFLLALTAGLMVSAGLILWSSVQERLARESQSRPQRERVVGANTVEVRAQTVVPRFTAFGQVRSRRSLELRSGVTGRVVELNEAMEDGAEVQAGTLLAQIDPSDAGAALDVARTDLDEAQADLRDAERTLALANDELQAAEAQANLRRLALQRQRDLEERGVGTTAAVEDAALAEASANQSVLTRRNAVVTAEGRRDQAENAVARAQIDLDRAERDLAETEIRAAFDGTLADVTVTEGGLVTQNEQIATLIDPASLEVAFRISTPQYTRLLDDQGVLLPTPVRVTLDVLGLDLEAEGRLTRVGATVGDGQTGRLIYAALDRHAGLRPGDFVSVTVAEPALGGVAEVPATALGIDGGTLAIAAEDRLENVPVTVLRRQGDTVLIRAPALEGRRIVVDRTPLLGPGIRVRDLTAEREATVVAGQSNSQSTEAVSEDLIALSPERRAALIAAVEGNARMPSDAKARVLAALQQDSVPVRIVERIEARMGG